MTIPRRLRNDSAPATSWGPKFCQEVVLRKRVPSRRKKRLPVAWGEPAAGPRKRFLDIEPRVLTPNLVEGVSGSSGIKARRDGAGYEGSAGRKRPISSGWCWRLLQFTAKSPMLQTAARRWGLPLSVRKTGPMIPLIIDEWLAVALSSSGRRDWRWVGPQRDGAQNVIH